MKRISILLIFSIVTFTIAYSQRLVAEAPSDISTGEQFRLTYTINTQNVSGDIHIGKLPDSFEILMGPSVSKSSSFKIVNGHTSSSSSITYTYIVCANKKGAFTIPSAHISVGGKSITSNSLRVNVSGNGSSSYNQAQQHSGMHSQQTRPAGSKITRDDLFIKVSANKRRIHEQEPVLLTYKVYTLVNLVQLVGKMPDLKGFHTQEVQLPQQKSFKVEQYDGRSYRTVTWSQYIMFPQVTGKLEIPSITFNGVVVQQNRNIDPFEAFFNGGSGYVEVKHSIKAPGITIQVDPLPTRPSGFSGGVGRFNISAQLNKQETKANDPVSLRVIVSGIGNLKLLKAPVVNFPKDFDTYDAKVTDKTKLTSNGVEGNMIYDYLAVPRHQGKYEIPPIEFTYYDIDTDNYKTIKTQSFTLDISKSDTDTSTGNVNSAGQEELKQLNKDIRYIKTGNTDIRDSGDFFFGSRNYLISITILMLIFMSLFIIFRQRAIDNADVGKMRGKKANKVATRRLKKAKLLMLKGNQNDFYDEVLRALWGYVGDKLNIPVEQLTRDNISQKLMESNVNADTINKFIGALDECEFERYAPGDAKGNMNKTFDAAMTAIMHIEEAIKKRKLWLKSNVTLLLIMALAFPTSLSAITKANADSAYAHQQYQQAIRDYEELLRTGVSPDLYYNLGNAYYRTDNITRAILNYERALLLSPGDKDIRFNLQMARSKTIDKITPESEMFFVTWYHSLINVMSVDGWAHTALLSLALAIALSLIYLFSGRIMLRKAGFFGGLFLIILFFFSNIFAYQQKKKQIDRTGAVIISTVVSVKSTPAMSGTDLFLLHEGTKVEIIDGSLHDWKEIRIADGKEGWIKASQMEII